MAASPAERVTRPRRLAAAALAALAAVACTAAPAAADDPAAPVAGEPAAPAAPAVGPPTARSAWVAHVLAPVRVYRTPGGRAGERIGTSAPWGGGPVRLLVLRARRDEAGALWVRVRLHRRPNDAAGWLRADRLRLGRTPWRAELDRSARRLVVYRGGRRVRSLRVVVGTPATPTPLGRFAVAERIRQPAGSALGPWALHLTAHSNVLKDYGGGPGRVALHGRSGPLLADPLGSARSHGCVRMDNADIRWMARRLREGTPVRVTP